MKNKTKLLFAAAICTILCIGILNYGTDLVFANFEFTSEDNDSGSTKTIGGGGGGKSTTFTLKYMLLYKLLGLSHLS